jgi:hypothetical protein
METEDTPCMQLYWEKVRLTSRKENLIDPYELGDIGGQLLLELYGNRTKMHDIAI